MLQKRLGHLKLMSPTPHSWNVFWFSRSRTGIQIWISNLFSLFICFGDVDILPLSLHCEHHSVPPSYSFTRLGNRHCKVNWITHAYSSSEPLTKSSKTLASQTLRPEPSLRYHNSLLWMWVIWYEPKLPDESIPVHIDSRTDFCGKAIVFSQQLSVQTPNNFLFLSSFCPSSIHPPPFPLFLSLFFPPFPSFVFVCPFLDNKPEIGQRK